jgi:hypothetical protein
MKKLAAVVSVFIPGTLFAHPGHGIGEQVHGLLHSEHLLILSMVIGALIVDRVIRNFFK